MAEQRRNDTERKSEHKIGIKRYNRVGADRNVMRLCRAAPLAQKDMYIHVYGATARMNVYSYVLAIRW